MTKFGTGAFRYNGNAGLALVPALAATLGFAHQMVAAVGIVGVLTTTILDLSGAKEATFFGVWVTLVMGFAGSVLAVLAGVDARARETVVSLEALFTLVAEAQLFTLVGFWATIQFKWVQVQHPAATLAMEKLVMTASPLVSLVLVAQGLIAAVGSGQAPFYCLACSLLLHKAFFSSPMPSSFVKGPARPGKKGGFEVGLVVQRDDAKVCTGALLAVPWLLYLVLHSPEIWPAASLASSATHLWSLLLLLGVPLMYLAVYSPRTTGAQRGGLLWWSGLSMDGVFAVRVALANVALVALVLGLEGRVVFRSFSQYIHLPAPWNYIAITLALSGGGAALVNFLIVSDSAKMKEKFDVNFSQTLEDNFAVLPSWVGVVFILSITAGCLALGMSTLALVAALTCAAGLVLFVESRLFRDYLVFVAGLTGTVAWFLRENFWYLDVTTGALRMTELCTLLTLCLVLSSLVPGIVICRLGGGGLLASVLVLQSVLLTYLERGMVFGSRLSRYDEGDFTYPPYLVLLTSGLGIGAVRTLQQSGKLGNLASWLLQCILAAKVSMLALHESHLVVPCTVVLMAVTAPVQLYRRAGRDAPAAWGRPGHHGRASSSGRIKMREWQGVCHAASIALAVLYARFTVFDVLQALLGSRPNEGLLVGSLLIGSSAACVPMLRAHFPFSQAGRRLVISVLASGLVIALVRPPMPIAGGARCPRLPFELCPRLWDSDHRPEHEADDVAIYGDLVQRREHWPKWLLVVAVISGLGSLGVGGGGRGGSDLLLRVSLALLSGAGIGSYISFELFPGYGLMQLVAGLTTCLCLLVLALVHMSRGTKAAFRLFLLLVLMLPASLGLTWACPPKRVETDDVRLYVDVERDLEADLRVGLLVSHVCYMMIVAFSIKLKLSGGINGRSRAEEARVGLIGNVATVETFVLWLLLFREGRQEGGGLTRSSYAVFMLCPILLLLNRDGLLFSGMREAQRYAPVAASVPLVLTSKAFGEILGGLGRRGGGGGGAWSVALNLASILLTLPNHLEFCKFLWRGGGLLGSVVTIVGTPLNLVAILATTLDEVRVQAIAGICFAVLQYFAERRREKRGMMIL
ncbi:hypothetical protein HOP50_03g24420 [Chloropicon primus]|uniref:Uncharacterized protein n=3 Tax=Chloropicon primus TaxID=1764295 RepID=A0A5B8MIN0_9CHLO|nr:hypothetical protein A3770_03p24420 [Chloropicon primus]UPQ99135.1 hypothetical protein HOP50_03g24420 [Chloropicon primus]|eukprot:QDZ19924.1 hypothetical protein A3770_03p24420 [Chloropicon primus]